jgi:hypothetical protein
MGTEQAYRSGPTALSSFEDQPQAQSDHASEHLPASCRGRRTVTSGFAAVARPEAEPEPAIGSIAIS